MNTQRVEGHTPLPWKHSANSHAGASSGGWHEICSNNRKPVAHLVSPVASSGYDDAETNANAEFIVHACNNIERLEKVNEALVEALKTCRHACKWVEPILAELAKEPA